MGKVLILQNAPLFTAGSFETELEAKRIPFEYHRVFEKGPPSVDLVAHYSGFIILGGPLKFRVDQTEKNPQLSKQIFFLRACLDSHKPILAVSQGACLLAQAQGAWVAREPRKEIGWATAEIYPDYARNSVVYSKVEEKKFPAFAWFDTFHGFPPTGYWYAYHPHCRYFSCGILGSSYLFNFHPEVTPELVESWLKEYGNELPDKAMAEQIRKETAGHMEFTKAFSHKIIHGFESFLDRKIYHEGTPKSSVAPSPNPAV